MGKTKRQFKLVDRPEEDISHWWKTLTLIAYFIAICGGIATSIGVGRIWYAFNNHCVLYSHILYIGLNQVTNGSKELRPANVDLENGDNADCSFCQYGSVISAMVAAIGVVFFLMCGRGGANGKRYKSISPAILQARTVHYTPIFINIMQYAI